MKNLERKIAFLLVLITTTVSAQIGVGTKTPHTDAMLEVKSTNKGLLLPRLSLVSTSSVEPLSAHVEGMSVYNTANTGDVTPGYYYNDGAKWVRLASGLVADASDTTNGLVRLAGDLSGTATAPTIAANAVTTDKIADGAVTVPKLNLGTATAGQVLKYNGTTWVAADDAGLITTTVSNAVASGALTTTVNGVDATPVTLPVPTDASDLANGILRLAGDLAGTAEAPTITNSAVISKVLNSFASGAGTISATDTVLGAIQKLDGNDALKAPLASPTFTGDAIAETATAGDNDTSLATTAFVTNAVTAAAPNASITVIGKILLAGDLTGTHLLPTIAADAVTSEKILDKTIVADDIDDNTITSVKLATNLSFPGTENITLPSGTTAQRPTTPSNGMLRYNDTTDKFEMYQNSVWVNVDATPANKVLSVVADYTSVATDDTILVDVPTGGATVTLPAAATNNGKILIIKKVDDDTDVLTFNTSVKVTASVSFTTLNYSTTLKIQSDGTNWWLIN